VATIPIQEDAVSVFVELQEVSFNCFAFGIREFRKMQSGELFQHIDVVLR